MLRFLREWCVLLAPSKWLKGAGDVNKALGPLILTALSSAAVFWDSVPWWVVPVVALTVFYFSLTAGMAWEKSSGPWVEISPLTLDAPTKVFFVMVMNGPVPVKQVRIKVVHVTDSSGISHIERSWEGHWRGRPADFDGDLIEYDKAQYGLLGVAAFPSGNPTLFIYSKDGVGQQAGSGHSGISISRDLPLREQGTITLEVVVACEATSGEKGRPRKYTFHVASDRNPSSLVGYKVVADKSPRVRGWSWRSKIYRRICFLFRGRRRGHASAGCTATQTPDGSGAVPTPSRFSP